MINIYYNFPKKDTLALCYCEIKEEEQPIYNCELFSDNKQIQSLAYNNIFNGNVKKQAMVQWYTDPL